MAFAVTEWYGYNLIDSGHAAAQSRETRFCPFINDSCVKRFRDSSPNGVCSVQPRASGPVAVCPNRMYADNYKILQDIADIAFGPGTRIISPDVAGRVSGERTVVAFGKRFGGELRLPRRPGQQTAGYFVDWILALLDVSGDLAEFVAVEVQTIDSTGNYREAVARFEDGDLTDPRTKANLNWENVNKRILAQLIYKGQVLRRERRCAKGLFFVCPSQVYSRMADRLGNDMMTYSNLQTGSITFLQYATLVTQSLGSIELAGRFSTTVDQVALAFTAPRNLPDEGVYELAILKALGRR